MEGREREREVPPIFNTQHSVTDVLACAAMKGAANCDTHCELQKSVSQPGHECALGLWEGEREREGWRRGREREGRMEERERERGAHFSHTTFSDGCLGLRSDEGRSELRQAM